MQPSILPVTSPDAITIAALARTIWQHHYVAIISSAQIEYMLMQRYQSTLIDVQAQGTEYLVAEAGCGSVDHRFFLLYADRAAKRAEN